MCAGLLDKQPIRCSWFGSPITPEKGNMSLCKKLTNVFIQLFIIIHSADLRLHFPLPVGQHLSERSSDIKAVQLKHWHQLLKHRQKISTAPAATSHALYPYLENRSAPHRNAQPSRSFHMHPTRVTSKWCPELQGLLSTQHQSCWIWQAQMSERKCERLMWSPTSQGLMSH